MLLSVDPISFVIILWLESHLTSTFLDAFHVLTSILWTVFPCESTLTIKITSYPLSIIPVLIWIFHKPFTLRKECTSIDMSLVMLSISIIDSCFLFWMISKKCSEHYLFCLRVISSNCPLLWSRVVDNSVEVIKSVIFSDYALSFNSPFIHLTLISNVFGIKDNFSLSMRFVIKLATIGIFMGDHNISSPFHLTILPIS